MFVLIAAKNGVDLNYIQTKMHGRDKRAIQNHIDKQKREAKKLIEEKQKKY